MENWWTTEFRKVLVISESDRSSTARAVERVKKSTPKTEGISKFSKIS